MRLKSLFCVRQDIKIFGFETYRMWCYKQPSMPLADQGTKLPLVSARVRLAGRLVGPLLDRYLVLRPVEQRIHLGILTKF